MLGPDNWVYSQWVHRWALSLCTFGHEYHLRVREAAGSIPLETLKHSHWI